MVARLAWNEVKRSLRSGRAVAALALMVGLSANSLRWPYQPEYRLIGSLAMVAYQWLPLAIALVAAAFAGSFAEDRRTALTLTIFTRGVSRDQYLLAKTIGVTASSGLTTLAGLCAFYLIAWITLPAGRSTFEPAAYAPG